MERAPSFGCHILILCLKFSIILLGNQAKNRIFIEIVKKLCHISGRWANRNHTADHEGTYGWTGYLDMCLSGDPGSMSAKSAEHNCWITFTSGFLYPILLVVLLILLIVVVAIGSVYLGRLCCCKIKKWRAQRAQQQASAESSKVATGGGAKESKIP